MANDHDPPAAVTEPTVTPPTRTLTVSPAVAAPLNDWVAAFVMLSVFDEPVSLAASRSGAVSVAGAV